MKTDDALLDYQYPNSQIIERAGGYLLLESVDSSQLITDWYKEKITDQQMSVKSFVSTKVNDKVLNKLVGSSGSEKISVEVSQEDGKSAVSISVRIN